MSAEKRLRRQIVDGLASKILDDYDESDLGNAFYLVHSITDGSVIFVGGQDDPGRRFEVEIHVGKVKFT